MSLIQSAEGLKREMLKFPKDEFYLYTAFELQMRYELFLVFPACGLPYRFQTSQLCKLSPYNQPISHIYIYMRDGYV